VFSRLHELCSDCLGGFIRIMDWCMMRAEPPLDSEPDLEQQRRTPLTPEVILYIAGARRDDFTRLNLSFTDELKRAEEMANASALNVPPS